MNQKAYDLLGLAQRAGRVQSGEAAVEAVLKKGRAKLLILAKDASERTKRHFIHLAEQKHVSWVETGEKLRLGMSLGMSPRSVVTVTDEHFAQRLHGLIIDGGKDL